jgi:hypothetical protein
MYARTPLSTVKSIIATSDTVGATLPKPVTDAHARAVRITTGAQHLHPGPDALTAAVVSALDAGRDPAADPEVARLHLSAILGVGAGMTRTVEDVVGTQLLGVVVDHAEAIIRAWAKPFDKAAAALVGAHRVIGDVPLDDTATILRAGGDIAATWAQATAASQTVGLLAAAWVDLATVTRFAPVDPNRAALRFADVAADKADSLDLRKLGAWDAVRAGLPLSLADGLTYRRRVAALTPDPVEARPSWDPWDSEPITAA